MIFIIILLVLLLLFSIPIFRYSEPIPYGNHHIPKIVITKYSKNMISDIYTKNWDNMQQSNPGYTFLKYDDDEARQFIISHFSDPQIIHTYDTLIPGSYKADLFRFCHLYITGGIYLDYNKRFTLPIDQIIPSDADIILSDDRYGYLYNALIIIRPKHDFMLKCIHQIVRNTRNRYYGPDALCPTGPGLFGRVYKQYFGFHKISMGRFEAKGDIIYVYHHAHSNSVYDLKGHRIMKTRLCRKQKSKENKNYKKYYGHLWHIRNIYKRHY